MINKKDKSEKSKSNIKWEKTLVVNKKRMERVRKDRKRQEKRGKEKK